jgi:hypothetical protein
MGKINVNFKENNQPSSNILVIIYEREIVVKSLLFSFAICEN